MSTHVTHLFSLLLSQGDSLRLADAVARSETQMKAAGEVDLWHFWKGQALLATGQLEEAATYVQQIQNRDQAEFLETLLQRAVAKKAGDSKALIETLANRFENTRNPLHLFELCEAYYDAKEWQSIVTHAKQLVEGVGTAAALRLAIESANRVGNFQLCLELLEGRQNLFPNGQFPADLRRLRVFCMRAEGQPSLAIPEAAALARETGASVDLLTLVSVRLEAADPRGAVIDARELLKRSDVAPEHHLQLAHALKVEDYSAAVAHLEKALATGNRSPEFLAGALGLIFQLNREEKFADLLPALQYSALKGGAIELAGPQRVVEVMRSNAERHREAEALYQKGRIPLHWALEHFGGTLGQAYDQRFHPPVSGTVWPPAPPLFIRHGGRVSSGSRGIKRLHIDISGLLIAAELELLDPLEQAFAPIYLPPSVIPAIYHEISATQPQQPSKLEEARLIVSLIAEGKLRVASAPVLRWDAEPGRPGADWLALMKAAQESGGFVVDYLPVRVGLPGTPVELSEAENKSITDCASVISTLLATGKLTTGEHEIALRQLGGLGQHLLGQELSLGTSLYLHGNIVEVLAGAGVLATACEHFQVYTEIQEQQQSEAMIDYEARCSQRRGRLRGVLDRIQRGLGQTWQLLPTIQERQDPLPGYESRCLAELMAAAPLPDTFVWIDDRFLNAFGSCEGNPIITVYGVLCEFHARGLLGSGAYFEKLHRLRKANLRHLPITADEILHHLGSARFNEGEIVETPEMLVLRQYVAACFSERGCLQLPPVPEGTPNPHGEIAFLLNALSAIRESMTTLWSNASEKNIAEVIGRANWLLRNLWYDSASLPWLLKQEGKQDEFAPMLLGASLAQLYTQGLSLEGKQRHGDKPGDSPRILYFRWLQICFGTDRETVETTAKHLVTVFSNRQLVMKRSKEEQNAFRAVSGELLEDIPRSLRLALGLSKETLLWLGVQLYDSVDIEGWSFGTHEFWRSAENALRGKPAKLTSRKNPQQFTVRYAEQGSDPVLYLSKVGSDSSFAVSDHALRVLDRSEEARRTVLRAHPEWFDCEEGVFYRHADRIAAIGNVSERLRQVEQWRSGSVAYFYESLSQRLDSRQPVNTSHFEPPSNRGVLNHLRLKEAPTDGALPGLLEASSAVLLREVGFRETFRRFAVLPLRMPQAVSAAYDALSPEQQATWRSEAIRELVSPVARLHVIGFVSKADPALALDLIEVLSGTDGQAECEAFRVLLLWTLGRLEIQAETSSWPSTALLIVSWLHAGRLYDMLTARSSHEAIRKFFGNAAQLTHREIFRPRPELLADVSHPRRLRPRALILHGLATGLQVGSFENIHQDRLRTLLRNLCFESTETVPLAYPDLLTPADWYRNDLGSFVCGDRGPMLEPWLGDEAQYLSTDLITERAKFSIEALQSSLTAEPAHWRMLTNILVLDLAPASLRDPLRALLLDERVVDLTVLDTESRRMALFFLMHQVTNFPEVLSPLRDRLINITQRLRESSKNGSPAPEDITLLIECAHLLSVVQPTAIQASREFSAIMLDIVRAWPAVTDEAWVILRGLIAPVPPSVLANLWPLLFELRKKARK